MLDGINQPRLGANVTVLLQEIERIAHELTGNGPDLLFSVAVDQLEFHGEITLAAEMREDVTRVLKEHRADYGLGH